VFPIFIDPANRKFIAVERIKGIPTRSRLCQNHGVVSARHEATAPADKMRKTVVNFFFLLLFFPFQHYTEVRQIPMHRTVILVFLFAPAVRFASLWYALSLSTDKYRSIYIYMHYI